ncbi:stage II sporulation protein P [Peribacillus alkalitolerans]|uniref:stage II sporulation protein P n=1 Tax=Peribacillus alkalitolerans TaxID=1550385 RepID=UPI0013D2C806|nr:stage II sporulation protein P [Peribacillus alkalitolerans]
MRRNLDVERFTIIQGNTIVKGFFSVVILMLFIFSVSGILTSMKPELRFSSQSVNEATSIFSGEMLYSLLAQENQYFKQAIPAKKKVSIQKEMLKYSANISLDDPRSLLGRELPGFSIFDSDILLAGMGTNYTNMPYESAPPLAVLTAERDAALQNLEELAETIKDNPNPTPPATTNGKKVVYVYHTHNRESFLPYLKGVTNPNKAQHSQINITKIGEKMTKELQEKGIGTVVDTTDVMGSLTKKGLTYPKAYQESRGVVQQAMASNKDLTYLIDIHRDSKRKKHTTVNIKGKNYAKLAFIIGGNNAQYKKNYAVVEKLHHLMEKKYPGLSRGVIKQQGANFNGKYNQDLSGNAMLIEFGGVDNTFEELYASVEAFTTVFSEYYWAENDAEPVNASAESEKK